jgi:hypothetical protein
MAIIQVRQDTPGRAYLDEGLYVWKGVLGEYLSTQRPSATRYVDVTLVVLTRAQQPGDQQFTARVDTEPPTGGNPMSFNFEGNSYVSGANGFAIITFSLDAAVDGQYLILVTAGGETVSVPVGVRSLFP